MPKHEHDFRYYLGEVGVGKGYPTVSGRAYGNYVHKLMCECGKTKLVEEKNNG